MVWRSTSMEPSPLVTLPVATSPRSTATLTPTSSSERATTRRTVITWGGPLMSSSFGRGRFHPRTSYSTTAQPQVPGEHAPKFMTLRKNRLKTTFHQLLHYNLSGSVMNNRRILKCIPSSNGFGDVSVMGHIVLPYKCRWVWGHGGRSLWFNVTRCNRLTLDCFSPPCLLHLDGKKPQTDGKSSDSAGKWAVGKK